MEYLIYIFWHYLYYSTSAIPLKNSFKYLVKNWHVFLYIILNEILLLSTTVLQQSPLKTPLKIWSKIWHVFLYTILDEILLVSTTVLQQSPLKTPLKIWSKIWHVFLYTILDQILLVSTTVLQQSPLKTPLKIWSKIWHVFLYTILDQILLASTIYSAASPKTFKKLNLYLVKKQASYSKKKNWKMCTVTFNFYISMNIKIISLVYIHELAIIVVHKVVPYIPS